MVSWFYHLKKQNKNTKVYILFSNMQHKLQEQGVKTLISRETRSWSSKAIDG